MDTVHEVHEMGLRMASASVLLEAPPLAAAAGLVSWSACSIFWWFHPPGVCPIPVPHLRQPTPPLSCCCCAPRADAGRARGCARRGVEGAGGGCCLQTERVGDGGEIHPGQPDGGSALARAAQSER